MPSAVIVLFEERSVIPSQGLDAATHALTTWRLRGETDHLGVITFGPSANERLRLAPLASSRADQLTWTWPDASASDVSPHRPPVRLALTRLTCAPRGARRRILLVSSGVLADERALAVLIGSLAESRVVVDVITATRHARVLASLAADTGGQLLPALHHPSLPSVLSTLITSEVSHAA